ncbi:MAG: pseudouridine synthase [Pseudomonadales bacterium]|nr:pseudouridine synthase [Pseudomonadales bacterium]MBO6595230.1 pseudouridine synthase [Pseudomonadales bacterium]MBO6821211.1 pseudouridine synthase [Pseudomonadales bacterium]
MSRGNLILFNKPYGVLSQFTGDAPTLAQYIALKGYYPAGRLDKDSEGLLLLTNDGNLQARIASPKFKLEKSYWVQVEGEISKAALQALTRGVELKDGLTRPAKARSIETPLPPRNPDIRTRTSVPTSWIELTISEGKNRQVRRMTAGVGFPTLRLLRSKIGPWKLHDLAPGEFHLTHVNF